MGNPIWNKRVGISQVFPWDRGCLFQKRDCIPQRKNILDLLKEIGKLGCKTSRVPIQQNHKIGNEENSYVEKTQYLILVGYLIYLSYRKPNIAYCRLL